MLKLSVVSLPNKYFYIYILYVDNLVFLKKKTIN